MDFSRFTRSLLCLLYLVPFICHGFLLDLNTSHIYSHPPPVERPDYFLCTHGVLWLENIYGFPADTNATADDLLLTNEVERPCIHPEIGAPKLNTSQLSENIIESGGLFSCVTAGDRTCTAYTIDIHGNNIATSEYDYAPLEDKSHQWLGATVEANPQTGFITTCAPFYVYKGPAATMREPVGQCFYGRQNAGGSIDFSDVSPCKDDYDIFYREYSDNLNNSLLYNLRDNHSDSVTTTDGRHNYRRTSQLQTDVTTTDGRHNYRRTSQLQTDVMPKSNLVAYIVLFVVTENVLPFNLDLDTVQTFHGGQSNSYFGYSLTLHRSLISGNSLLVGAPLANTSALLLNNIVNGGALYRCHLSSGSCWLLSVDDRPNRDAIGMEPETTGLQGESRSNQWLGATVVSDSNGTIAICAPRYVNFGPRATKREPTGDCFVSRDDGFNFTRVSPCTDDFTIFYRRTFRNISTDMGFASYHKTGHGMCGYSVALGADGELGVGSVGSFYWQGQLYSVASANNYRSYISTGVRGPTDDDAYMTWDTKSGEFDNNRVTKDYVVTAPRAEMLRGKVMIWSRQFNSMVSLYNITGDQTGSYFGYAVAVGDYNGDDLDDIAVSAPFHADFAEDKPEVGRVTIFHQNDRNGQLVFRNKTTLTGVFTGGRFGQSLANLGSLNNDAFDELAVGAPYAGPEERGIVYIYFGSRKGLIEEAKQVIHAEDLPQPLITFGWSLAGNMDVDGNRHNDLAIGAYKSDAAVLMKARPLVKIYGSLLSPEESIKLPVPCSDADYNPTAFSITLCVGYTSLKEPEETSLRAKVMLDSANNHTKRAFEKRSGQSVTERYFTMKKSNPVCIDINGYVNPDIRDKTTPIEVSVDVELIGSNIDDEDTPRPIIDIMSGGIKPIQFELPKSCDECKPDLSVSASTNTVEYTLGTNDKIDLNVSVNNAGQDSYLTTLNLTLPAHVSYVNILKAESCIAITCQQYTVNTTDSSHDYISCDIGNPLPQNQMVIFTVRVRVDNLEQIEYSSLEFPINVASDYADDINPSNNEVTVTIPLKVVTDIEVTGRSDPAEAVIYNDTHLSDESSRGPDIQHEFEVYSVGPSAISSAKIDIQWPLYSKNLTTYLLFIYEPPEVTQGDATCVVPTQYKDPRNLNSTVDGISTSLRGENLRPRRANSEKLVSTCGNDQVVCVTITCNIRQLSRDQSVIIKIKSYLWMSEAFRKLSANYTKETILTSTASSSVLDVPYHIKPDVYDTSTFSLQSYFEKYRPTQVLKPLEWRWIVIGVSVGLFLLIVISIILWKCGFFKRYRPHEAVKVEKHKDGEKHETERLYPGYT